MWIKPADVSKFRLLGEKKTLYDRDFVVDDRTKEEENPPEELECEECKQK